MMNTVATAVKNIVNEPSDTCTVIKALSEIKLDISSINEQRNILIQKSKNGFSNDVFLFAIRLDLMCNRVMDDLRNIKHHAEKIQDIADKEIAHATI